MELDSKEKLVHAALGQSFLLDLYVQADCCSSIQYAAFPKCLSCEDEDSEGCRFLFFRLFSKSLTGHILEVKGFIKLTDASVYNGRIYRHYLAREGRNDPGRSTSTLLDNIVASNESKEEREKSAEEARYVLSQIREPVLEILNEVQDFILKFKGQLHHRKPLAPFCQMCDFCNGGIFSAYWFCRGCGIEVCLDCFSTQMSSSFDGCIHSEEHNFIPMTNYSLERISRLHSSVKAFVKAEFENTNLATDAYLFMSSKSLAYPFIAPQEFNMELFRAFWREGLPIVVKASETCHVTPTYFIEKHGHIETDTLKLNGKWIGTRDLAAFFKNFNSKEHFDSNLKIKDFPQSQKFSDLLPSLYSKFLNQLPLQKYMRYDGPFNLVSLLPAHTHIVPDLGPKLYAAYAGKTASRTGTTQLHLDPADAINIMQSMAGPANEAGALWHVFRHSDVGAIRRFLRANLKRRPVGDFIHDQAFYLTDSLLKKLYNEEGVLPFLIKQKVGEIVIVPAGCPHQVRNLYPCIKIALGFVTPESAPICVKLAKEFCKLPRGHTRNSDILNLPTLLIQAWGTCMQRIGQVIFSEDDIFVPSASEKRSFFEVDTLASKHSKT